MANICGSFFSAYPATGSFSRSAVYHESGARTGFAGIVTGLTMGCALFLLAPLFRDIPQCALEAIVISVGISLVDYEEALFFWRVDKKDFLLWTITCITILFLGIEIGVLVGIYLHVHHLSAITASAWKYTQLPSIVSRRADKVAKEGCVTYVYLESLAFLFGCIERMKQHGTACLSVEVVFIECLDTLV